MCVTPFRAPRLDVHDDENLGGGLRFSFVLPLFSALDDLHRAVRDGLDLRTLLVHAVDEGLAARDAADAPRVSVDARHLHFAAHRHGGVESEQKLIEKREEQRLHVVRLRLEREPDFGRRARFSRSRIVINQSGRRAAD